VPTRRSGRATFPKLQSPSPAFHEPAVACRRLTTTTTDNDAARPYILRNNMGEGEIIKNTYPPSRLGEYTVIQEIAEGTFGKVKSGSLVTDVRASCMLMSSLQWPSILLQGTKSP
jgi:hypothetical protein